MLSPQRYSLLKVGDERNPLMEKLNSYKKNLIKSTYPPPADGPCVLFLCNSGCSANEPAAQAGRGALQPIGNCTECKVLKRSAARLHGGAQSGRGGRSGEVPGFIGRKILKRGFRCVFKNAHDLFRVGTGWGRGEAEFPARHDWRGL